ncbi:MOSC domain-containing protein [Mesorhizobium sp. SB112]|uniref:MOSC domain-containing protein n=1 Tax=Mesorhizobium sp. SB112 TaxID=3151853 RepID=UPI003263862A
MAEIVAVCKSAKHTFMKGEEAAITLIAGIGVEGDAHSGTTVKHRSRVRADPTQPNLRQVHLIPLEIIEELNRQGFMVNAGEMGENITTKGLDLAGLPQNTILTLGDTARVQVTGLRNPCFQLDDFQQGLMTAVLGRDEAGNILRKAGIMTIVLEGGVVKPSDPISVSLPALPHVSLGPV